MTEQILQEIEARCNAAETPPWTWAANHVLHKAPYVGAGKGGGRYVCVTSIAADNSGVKDAEFIAHARTDIPALIAALREAWHTIENMREEARHDGIEKDLLS